MDDPCRVSPQLWCRAPYRRDLCSRNSVESCTTFRYSSFRGSAPVSIRGGPVHRQVHHQSAVPRGFHRERGCPVGCFYHASSDTDYQAYSPRRHRSSPFWLYLSCIWFCLGRGRQWWLGLRQSLSRNFWRQSRFWKSSSTCSAVFRPLPTQFDVGGHGSHSCYIGRRSNLTSWYVFSTCFQVLLSFSKVIVLPSVPEVYLTCSVLL